MVVRRVVLMCLGIVVLATLVVACGGNSFTKNRAALVTYLQNVNRAANNLQDSMKDASNQLQSATSSEAVLAFNAYLTSLTSGLEGYRRQIDELAPPKGVPEAAEMRKAELAACDYLAGLVQEMRSTFQAGNQAAFLAVLQKFGALENDPIANKGYELQKVALIKYTIPDAEVYFRRLK